MSGSKEFWEAAKEKTLVVICVMIGLALFLPGLAGIFSGWVSSLIAGFFLNAFIQIVIYSISGDFFENISVGKVWGFRISMFLVLTVVLKFAFFR